MSDDTSMIRPALCGYHDFSSDESQGQMCRELVPDGLQEQVLLLIDQRIREREADDPGERPRITRRSSIAFVAMRLDVEPRVVRRHARGWWFAWPRRELRRRVYERVLETVCPYRLAKAEAELAELVAKDARRASRERNRAEM